MKLGIGVHCSMQSSLAPESAGRAEEPSGHGSTGPDYISPE
jgi:hypothetical protein